MEREEKMQKQREEFQIETERIKKEKEAQKENFQLETARMKKEKDVALNEIK